MRQGVFQTISETHNLQNSLRGPECPLILGLLTFSHELMVLFGTSSGSLDAI